MKKVVRLQELCNLVELKREDFVILLDEVYIPEKEMTVGLYYWPWKNEYVCWCTFDHEKKSLLEGLAFENRGMNWGDYYSAHTTEEQKDMGGLKKAVDNFIRKATYHGAVITDNSTACR